MAWALALNVALCIAAFVAYFRSGSHLVLAQGSDSLQDLAAGGILAFTAWLASQPRDANHPYGHDRAEPLGAGVTAVLAGVLAFEVLRGATVALVTGETARMDVLVAVVLGAKFVTKAVLLGLLHGRRRRARSSAIDALFVDTRNDVVACASSLFGYALARSGFGWADAALAIPVGLYIGASGLELARDNLRYLMGEAPDASVLAELHRRAGTVEGVLQVGRVRAQYVGPVLHVAVEVLVGEAKSATQGHDIAVEVQHRLEDHELVGEAFVHVDTSAGRDHD